MKQCAPIPADALDRLPPHAADPWAALRNALAGLGRKIVVLDDDPTGVQTVHDVYVYTRWDRETILEAFRAPEQMFFVLTNSRGLTAAESRAQHTEIAENIAAASKATGKPFLLLSRGDSTLRGHWPMETEVLRETLEARGCPAFDGEVIYPFFPEGGRFTLDDVHYVRQGEQLVPAGQTEFAGDKSFGYTASALSDWCEEKSAGRFPAEGCCRVMIGALRAGDVSGIAEQLAGVTGFGKICVDSADYGDTAVFVTALCGAIAAGKNFLFRCAAALPKVLGGVEDRPLLEREELVDAGNRSGGIILVGSHVNKTSRQLAAKEKPETAISGPVHLIYLVYTKTRRIVDDLNLYAAIDDLLVNNDILDDDNTRIVKSRDGSRVRYDPYNPRVEITILESDEGDEPEQLGLFVDNE